MREPLKDRVRLEHIQTAINNIFQYTAGTTIQQLNDDTMLFYATVKNVEIIRQEQRTDRSSNEERWYDRPADFTLHRPDGGGNRRAAESV